MGRKLKGEVYKDNMCLIHSGEPGDTASARLCVKNLPFIQAPMDGDDNSYEGVLGLAPSPNGRDSYVSLLKTQGVISDAIVSFNYENPDEWNQIS